jgi:hypothetical protein
LIHFKTFFLDTLTKQRRLPMSRPFARKEPNDRPTASDRSRPIALTGHLKILAFLITGFIGGLFLYPAGTFAKAGAFTYVLNLAATYALYSVDRRSIARGSRSPLMIVICGVWSAAAFRAVVAAIKAWGTLLF